MTSEEKMDLDAVDELAWFRIIDFLDYKSRSQCRHLSRTIKRYVDLSGLSLQPKWSKWFNKNFWKKFLKNPDIRISKVHFSTFHWKSETIKQPWTQLKFTAQHQVKYLNVGFCGSRSYSGILRLLKADWTRSIETLVCSSLALDIPKIISPESETIIEFPCLRKLYIIYEKQNCKRGQRRKVYDITKMVNILLLKIRSPRMKLIFVELIDYGIGVNDETLSLRKSLAQFIQRHAATLQTVIFKNEASARPEPGLCNSPETFGIIPFGLKHFDVDFFAYLDSESPWFKMLSNSLRHLESFNNIHYGGVDPLNHTVYPNFLSNLCRLNSNTLNYIRLTIRWNDIPMDLNTFSCCTSLKYLYLVIEGLIIPVYLKNLTMLPASLKCFCVERDHGMPNPISDDPPGVAIESENVANFSKFQNLVNFWLDAPVTFKNSKQLIHFTKVMLRLRKLDFFKLGDVKLMDVDTAESFLNRTFFFDARYERNLGFRPKREDHFEMQLAVSPDYRIISDMDDYSTKKEFGSVYYEHVYGYVNLRDKIEAKLSLQHNCRRVETWPPPIHHTRFQIGHTRHIF